MTCFYNESKGTARNHYTGEYESGVLRWQPETCADRTPLRDLYPKSEWPFTSTNYKPKFRSISMLANSPIMRQICPANYIEMNTADAESLGIANGDWVDVENPTGDVMHAQALVRDGIAYGTFAVAYGYGHFAYGAQDLEIDGEKRPGDPAIGAGVHLQTMLDPKVEGVLPISDPKPQHRDAPAACTASPKLRSVWPRKPHRTTPAPEFRKISQHRRRKDHHG